MTFSEELKIFGRTHKYQKQNVGKYAFRYILSGQSDKPAIVFFNGLEMQEMWIKYMEAFESDYRVLMLEYPLEIKTNNELTEAIAALLKSLDIEKPIVIGGSDVGALAQIYAKNFPDDVGGLVLITTLGIDSDYLRKIKKMHFLTPLLLMKIKHANWDKLKANMFKMVTGYFADETEAEKEYGRTFFQAILSDPNYKNKYIHFVMLVADMTKQKIISIKDFPALRGKVLLLLPQNDIFSKSDQKRLIALMDGEKTVWTNGGHLSCVMRTNEYIEEIRRFLPRCIK